jgi:hypothetical protein
MSFKLFSCAFIVGCLHPFSSCTKDTKSVICAFQCLPNLSHKQHEYDGHIISVGF